MCSFILEEREKRSVEDYLNKIDDLYIEKNRQVSWSIGIRKGSIGFKLTLSRVGTSSNFLFSSFLVVLIPAIVQIPYSVLLKSFFSGKSFSSISVRWVSQLSSISSKIVKSSASRSCLRTAVTRGARDVG